MCVCVHVSVFAQHLGHSDARSYRTSPLFVLKRPMYSGASTYIPQSRMNPNEQRGTDHEEKKKKEDTQADRSNNTSESEKKASVPERSRPYFTRTFQSETAVLRRGVHDSQSAAEP